MGKLNRERETKQRIEKVNKEWENYTKNGKTIQRMGKPNKEWVN